MTRKITVNLTDTIEIWRNSTNTMAEYIGEPDNLNTTDKTNLVSAINEIRSASNITGFTSAISVVSTGNGNHTQLTYDSTSGLFSFNSNAVGPTHLAPLPSNVITSGTFSSTRIPNLSTTKITSGVFPSTRIPSIQSLSGQLAPAQVGFASQDVSESPSALYYNDSRARAAFSTDSNLSLSSTGRLSVNLSPATIGAVISFDGIAGTGVTIGSSDSISIGQDVSTTSSPTFVGVNANSLTTSNLNCTGAASFTGTVSGTALGGGIVASDAATDAGTANDVAITPSQLARQLAPIKPLIFRSTYTSLVSFTGSVLVPLPASWSTHVTNVSHAGVWPNDDLGLPHFVTYRLRRNGSTDHSQGNYLSGDMIDIYPNNTTDISGDGTSFRVQIVTPSNYPSATYGGFVVTVANDGPGYALGRTNNSDYFKINPFKWELQIIAVRFGEGLA